jgi:plasmid stabilization system protein ParE
MPDTYFVRITPRALSDLEKIFEYIRQDSPQNAASTIDKLLAAIEGLNILPHRFDVPRVGTVRGRQSPLHAGPPIPRAVPH